MTPNLCQFFTPIWVAEALVKQHFADLGRSDMVLEPSCGLGAFLRALPLDVPAMGVEIDPVLADRARTETGRSIITGDFQTVDLDVKPTAVIGNPPFQADVIDAFLDRCHLMLPEGGKVGFILPTYLFQTAERVSRYADRWSLKQELLPRNAFHSRMQTPLLFVVFAKDPRRRLVGFALYREAADLKRIRHDYRLLLEATHGSIWRTVCHLALSRLGGEASLSDIYSEVEGRRPTRTKFWKEKIRQTLRAYRQHFRWIDVGRYALVTQGELIA